MNDLYAKIDLAKQHEVPQHAPKVDRTEQVNVGLEMADRMAHKPEPEPVAPQPQAMPIPN